MRPVSLAWVLLAALAPGALGAAGEGSPADEAIAKAVTAALRDDRRDTGDDASSLLVWPVQVDERLDDGAPPFPFERGEERLASFRERREESVREVAAHWLHAAGIAFAPESLGRAIVEAAGRSVAHVVGPGRAAEVLAATGAGAGAPSLLRAVDRSELLRATAAPRILRARVGLTYEVEAWDWTDERFLPIRMTLRPRVRFEILDTESAAVLGTYESNLLDRLVYEPEAEVVHVSTEARPAARGRRRTHDVHVRVRVSNMMGREATVGFCMETDARKSRSMHLRWGPMDTVSEEFEVTFSDVEEPPVGRRGRVDVRAWVAQGYGTRKRRPGPCEANRPEAELAYAWRRVR